LRHVASHIVPHSLGRKLPGLNTGYRLDVHRNPFLDPVVSSVHGRKGQVDHFVREHPIIVELRNGCVFPERDVDIAALVGISDSAMDSGASANSNVEAEVGDRELAVISADGIAGTMDPVHQVTTGGGVRLAEEIDVDSRATDVDARRWTRCLLARRPQPHNNPNTAARQRDD
jgi:hypothetical protein